MAQKTTRGSPRHPRCLGSRLLRGAAGTLGLAGLEAILEAARHILEVAHAAGADSLSALALLTPVD